MKMQRTCKTSDNRPLSITKMLSRRSTTSGKRGSYVAVTVDSFLKAVRGR